MGKSFLHYATGLLNVSRKAALESNGTINQSEAFAMASSNLERALGLTRPRFEISDVVMYQGGGIFDFESKVIGVISVTRKVVELF